MDFFKNQNIKEVYKGSQLVWNKNPFITNNIGYFALYSGTSRNDALSVIYIPKDYNSNSITRLGKICSESNDTAFVYKNKIIVINLNTGVFTYKIYKVTSSNFIQENQGTINQINVDTDPFNLNIILDYEKGYIYVAYGHFSKSLQRVIISSDVSSLSYDNAYGSYDLNKGTYNKINTLFNQSSSAIRQYFSSSNPNYPVVSYSYGTDDENVEGFNLETKQNDVLRVSSNDSSLNLRKITYGTPKDFDYACDKHEHIIYKLNRDNYALTQIASYPLSESSGREDGVRVEISTNDTAFLIGYDLAYVATHKTYRHGTSSRDPIDYYKAISSIIKISTGKSVWNKEFRYSHGAGSINTFPNAGRAFYCPWAPEILFNLDIDVSSRNTPFIFRQNINNKEQFTYNSVTGTNYDYMRLPECSILGYVEN